MENMQLTWMGEYRDLVASLMRFGNAYSQAAKHMTAGDKVRFGAYEVQILEHILEYGDQNKNMAWFADKLGIERSTFSKCIKKLCEKGLLEKYHLTGNKKNVILRLTPLGIEEYKKYIHYATEKWFNEFFHMLENMSDQSKADIKLILDSWSDWCAKLYSSGTEAKQTLIKIPD